MRLIRLIAAIWRLKLARYSIKASICLAMLGKGLGAFSKQSILSPVAAERDVLRPFLFWLKTGLRVKTFPAQPKWFFRIIMMTLTQEAE
jgi:hypothetical protein